MSHNKFKQPTTTCVFELLLMDLMRPMQVKSVGEKRYVFVYDETYSKYTCVKVICEKYNNFDGFEAHYHHL